MKYSELKTKQYLILDLTTLTNDEFELLVPPFEEAFSEHMSKWCMDGLPRTSRGYTVYKNCPLPTPEDRLLFILSYIKTNPLQAYHGAAFRLPQCKANTWIHLLLKVLANTFQTLGDSPSRNIQELTQKLANLLQDKTIDETESSLDEQAPPFLPMTGQNAPLVAPKMRLNKKRLIAARKNDIRKKILS